MERIPATVGEAVQGTDAGRLHAEESQKQTPSIPRAVPTVNPGRACGLSHAGIQVADADRSIAFYERLGLRLAARWSDGRTYLQPSTSDAGATLNVVVMAIPGSASVLEILEHRSVDGSPVNPVAVSAGTGHVCFLVDDLDVLYEQLLQDGVEFVSPPQVLDAGPNTGGWAVRMKDPDGTQVELLQPSRRATGEARRDAVGADEPSWGVGI